MTIPSVVTVVEIYLCDPFGVRIECLDYVTEYDYNLVVNKPGTFRLKLPSKFDRSNIRLDNIVEIWRGHGPGTLHLEYCGFLRAWKFADESGIPYTELYGVSTMELLERRIVVDWAGSANALVTDYADDMIKFVGTEQLGTGTTASRDLTAVGGGFTIQADLGDAPSMKKGFAYKNVLEICQEIADASAQAGTELYFDIVPRVSSTVVGQLAFQLQTFTGQRGMDRTLDGDAPVYIGDKWGNFENGSWEVDYLEEKNWVRVGGQGEGESRDIEDRSDTTRINASIWNMREGFKDARHVDQGDTTALEAEGDTYLNEHKPRLRFSGDIVETPAFRYAKDWGFGDRVTVAYAGYEHDAMIKSVSISRGTDGQETITARLEVEEDL